MFTRLRSMFGAGKAAIDESGIVDVMVDETRDDGQPAAAAAGGDVSLLAGELLAAQKIQMSLIPKTFPPIPGCLPFDLYAILEPAREIGGDFYDFWLNGRDNLVMVIGDVSGKGIPAALFMAVCRTYLRAFSRSVGEPAKLLGLLNGEVSRHNDSCMFVTLFCAVVNIPTGKVVYANAGHNPPFVRRADGSVETLPGAEDAPVGFMPDTVFTTRSLRLKDGESILFYTDGMPEAFNAKRQQLGDDTSLRLFREAARGGSCRTAIGTLQAEISEFVGNAEPSDDVTLMMYGQLPQARTAASAAKGADESDFLSGETAMMASLSNIHSVRLRPDGRLPAGQDDMGQSLSGL